MRRGRWLVTAWALALLACQLPAPIPFFEEAARPGTAPMRWPLPPAEARIVYLGQISDRAGFAVPDTWSSRIGRWLRADAPERLVRPSAVSVRGDRLAVADPGRPAVHVLDLSRRRWTTITEARGDPLRSPVGVLLLPDERLLVSDSATERLWIYDTELEHAVEFTDAVLRRPTGLALDPRGSRVWVAETLGHRVRAFDLSGRELARFGDRGSAPGRFNYPAWLASDAEGGVWVTDSLNFRLQHVAAAGPPDRLFGAHGDRAGEFARPRGLAVDRQGRILVVDALFDSVQIFDSEGHLLFVFGGRGNGSGEFWLPSDIALDADNRVYVADSYNGRVQIFAYRPPRDDAE